MNIYLDIDGVLLANEKFLSEGAEDFLRLVLAKYPDSTYWLTTHCMDGDASLAMHNVGKLCSPEVRELIKLIKPTTWKVAKTEAIDFNQPFLWFDDDLYDEERADLEKHGVLDNWVEVDLRISGLNYFQTKLIK